MKRLNQLFYPCVILFLIVMSAALYAIFFYAPVERTMGIVQKIFYMHVPAAMSMYAGLGLTSLSSLLYLLKPSRLLDDLALMGAELGMLFGAYVLISGPLWAYKAWGVAWTWDPQLTATLILFLLYGGYLALRYFTPNDVRMRKIGASLAVLAAIDIPVIHYAVEKWGGLHPVVEREGGGGLTTEMQTAFGLSMVAFLLLVVVIVWLQVRLSQKEHEVEELYLYLEDLQRSKETR